jgi:hypothetical protein
MESVKSIVNRLLVCAAVVLTAYVGIYLPIKETAGQTTAIHVLQQWVFDANLNVYIAWAAGMSGVVYGYAERRKRLREREERDKRIRQLEEAIDPERQSSGATPEGESTQKKPDKGGKKKT